MDNKITVVICGALGKMGKEAVRAVEEDAGMELMGLIDVKSQGETLFSIIGQARRSDLLVAKDLDEVLAQVHPKVLIDFTNPQSVFENVRTALKKGIICVIGTTGLNDLELQQLDKLARDNQAGVAVIPNFAIGAVLMMKFAQEAARYFPDVEIIELHHDQKMDAPSGTAIKTAELIEQKRGFTIPRMNKEIEKIPGCRGGAAGPIRIHSVRLPGLVAHQEVIFGGLGQSLTIRHDSYDRIGFMPGVLMVVKEMQGKTGLIYGMDSLL